MLEMKNNMEDNTIANSNLTIEELKEYLKLSLELHKLKMEMMNNMMTVVNVLVETIAKQKMILETI
jgi:hypothetical protein